MDPHHNRDNAELTEAGDVHAVGNSTVPPADSFERRCELIKIVDGDTLRLRIDLGWATTKIDDIRLDYLDTPENRGPERPAGLWVTEQVTKWILDRTAKYVLIRSNEFKVGKYGRCLAEVWVGGDSLNEFLLSSRYAWPSKGGIIIGPRDIARLGVPDFIKRQMVGAP